MADTGTLEGSSRTTLGLLHAKRLSNGELRCSAAAQCAEATLTSSERFMRDAACLRVRVKVNRGECEGATIWFRNEGDTGPFGKSDLVFVVKQECCNAQRASVSIWARIARCIRRVPI